MTVKIEVLDPQTESPSTLRALAHLFNVIAADKDGGKPIGEIGTLAYKVEIDTADAEAALNRLEGNASKLSDQGTPAAPSASTGSTPPPPPPAASAPGAENGSDVGTLDKNGLPWDERIHSSSKNMNADGTWRYLRGGDATVRAQVEAELRAAMGNGASSETPPPPPAVATTSNSAPAGAGDVPPPPPPPVPAPGADVPPPPPPVAAPAAEQGDEAITMQMAFKRAGQLSPEVRSECLELIGLKAMGEFVTGSKTDETLPQRLWDAIVAITGEE